MKTPNDETTGSAITPHENGGTEILKLGKHEWHETTPTGIIFRNGTPEEYWLDRTREAIAMFEGSRDLHLRSMFALGDCLNFGEGAFGERYAQAIDSTRKAIRLATKTIQNVAWICGSVPAQVRHEMLYLGHHEAVAKITDTGEQKELLDMAEDNEWSISDLKKEVRKRYPSKKRASDTAAGAKKAIIDMSDEQSVMLAAEKVAEFLGGELCQPIAEMSEDRRKAWSPKLLSIVEEFAAGDHDAFFMGLAHFTGAYLDRIEAEDPLRAWTPKRKERWKEAMNALAKAGRRMGVIGGAKPHQRSAAEQEADAAEAQTEEGASE